ncbi:hypothetical protein X777_05569, partial [Ooceraea biroi]
GVIEDYDADFIEFRGWRIAIFDLQPSCYVFKGKSRDSFKASHMLPQYALISPNIFTKYGSTHTYIDFFKIDLFLIKNKCEIYSKISFEFPEDSFDVLWQEGLQTDCTSSTFVETFRQLLASPDRGMQKCISG